jgi:hypothetical protein
MAWVIFVLARIRDINLVRHGVVWPLGEAAELAQSSDGANSSVCNPICIPGTGFWVRLPAQTP